ncbi:MAG: alpha/beta fold hydrolase [Actinomycetia bacterium]|nr:alpha/beta fold hydrolase [Actinomycetes bacterium]
MPYADVNGIRLYYEERGSGQPVVQIHGSGFGRGNFATLTPLLSRSFRVIDYDMRGFGDSDAPVGPYSMELWADDLAGLLDALEIERAHVHGTSMGGMVAIPFAAKYPGRLDRLVLSCSLAAYDGAARMNKRVWHAVAKAYGKGDEFLDLVMFQLFSRPFLESERMGEARELIAKLISSQTSPEVFAEITKAIEAADLVPLLPTIDAPTLVIGGRYDIMTPIDMGPSGAGSRVLAESIPQAELAVLDAGHTFLVEQPEASCELITEFLGRAHAAGAAG